MQLFDFLFLPYKNQTLKNKKAMCCKCGGAVKNKKNGGNTTGGAEGLACAVGATQAVRARGGIFIRSRNFNLRCNSGEGSFYYDFSLKST